MNQYYLMAQLPSLDGIGDTAPLPITEEAFQELCARSLGKKAMNSLQELTLLPGKNGENTSSQLVNAWNDCERQLRLALGIVRGAKMKKPFDPGNAPLSPQLMQAARTAVEMSDPLSAEQYLNQYRLGVLDALRPRDAFCEDAVLHYGLKLKLLLRMRQFDVEKGRKAYRNIYDSILHGDGQENES